MAQYLVAIQYIGLFVLFLEGYLVFKKWNSRLHAWLFLDCVTTFVCNAGYLVEIQATSQDMFIKGWQIAYIGNVWIAFSLFMFSAELCNVQVPKVIVRGLSLFHIATMLIILTSGHHTLYYTYMNYRQDGIVPYLDHGNGIWHHIYFGAVLVYAFVVIGMLVITIRKERNAVSRRRLIFVTLAMLCELAFFLPRFLKLFPEYDFTNLGNALCSVFIVISIFRFNLLDTRGMAKDNLIEELPEGIIFLNGYGYVNYFNKAAKEIIPELELTPDLVVADLDKTIEAGETITRGDRIFTPEKRSLLHDGTAIGTMYGLIDVTEHVQYTEELTRQREIAENANKAKSAFLASMSHEIRTPINAILGMNEMILRESKEEDILEYAGDIFSAGNTLLTIINDILDFSKIEEGRMEIIPVHYRTGILVYDLCNMIKDRATRKNLEFIVEVDENIPSILTGDEIRIRQCILNILTNAVKYTDSGSVTLNFGYTKEDDSHIFLNISVRDTGNGIKPEDMEDMFIPFTRLEMNRNRTVEGTGLGMSITTNLLELMGSELKVESVYGEGSTFSFSLRQLVNDWTGVGDYSKTYNEYHKSAISYHELFHAPEARLLVVDDTRVNLNVITKLLKRTQMQIDTAFSGPEAIEKAKNAHYDIMLIDHMMPEMDGIETLQRLKAQDPDSDTVYIVLTANAISGAREMYLAAGFHDYLSKPVKGKILEDMIRMNLPPEKIIPY